MTNSDDLWLVIPTANRFQYLEKIFLNSGISPDKRLLIRTALGPKIPNCINIFELDTFNIHFWWNLGIEYATSQGGRYVAVLNDDIELSPGALQELLELMKLEKSALALPVSKGDAAWGHCWIIDTQSGIKPDERFTWWCGDRDLEIQAKKSAGITYKPLFTLNLHANELTVANPKLEALTQEDIKLFYRKYPFRSASAYPIRLMRRVKRRLAKK